MSEYIKIATHSHLIGKRAKFKQRQDYSRHLWGQEGKIVQLHMVKKGDLEHVGLSLEFKNKTNNMGSCYIAPGSIEILEKVPK